MTPHIATFDDFFPMPHQVIGELVAKANFQTELNPVDGIHYEGIATNIDSQIASFIKDRMARLFERPVTINYQFVRLMTVATPMSSIHEDSSMGEFSLHVYLTDSPGFGIEVGTQFWKNRRLGVTSPPKGALFVLPTVNNPAEWDREMFISAKFNRALLHASNLFHSAEPAGGFGHNQNNGRLVLTTFFSRSDR